MLSLKPYRRPEPQIDSIWVIVPLSRPEMLPAVRRQFEWQSYRGGKLCIVENGRAVGACAAAGYEPQLLLTSEAHQATAKNTALDELRHRGGGYWTNWDDDDWYGPEYLAELAGHVRLADYVGKGIHFVSMGTESGPELYFSHPTTIDTTVQVLAGACMGGWVETTGEFPSDRVGEDTYFCLDRWIKGASFYAMSPYHFIYQRHYPGAVHTWPRTAREFLIELRAHGGLALGPVDYLLVTGEKPILKTREIVIPELHGPTD